MKAGDTKTLSLFPWTSGYAMFGHPAAKRENGLRVAKNQVRDFDGTIHRRGGQRKFMRNAIYEGQAFSTHFLDDTIPDTWSITESGGEYNLNVQSHIQFENTTTGITLLTVPLDVITTVTTTTSSLITYRIKFGDLPSSTTYTGFQIELDEGVSWTLLMKHLSSGVYFYTTSWEEVSTISGVVNSLSATSAAIQHTNWMNWKLEISKTGTDYFAAIYVEETLAYSNIPISGTTTGTRAITISLQGDGGSGDIDVTIDNLEIDATVQEIRGIAEFRSPSDSAFSVRRLALYAGSRVYLCDGDIYRLLCIDDGLESGRVCSFENYNGALCYVTSNGCKVRHYRVGDRRGEEIGESPRLTMLRAHASRLFGAGNPDQKSVLYWCGLTDETVWNTGTATGTAFTNAGNAPINSDDGEKITGIGLPFMKTLPLYKEGSIYRLDGTGPADFVISPVTREVGAASHFAIANVLNDQFFLSRYGVHSLGDTDRFGEVETTLVSKELQTLWRREVNLDRLDLAWAVNNEELDRYEVFVPTYDVSQDGLTLTRVFVLHYGVQAEEFPRGLWTDKRVTGRCMAYSKPTGLSEFKVFVGRTDGHFAMQDCGHAFDFPEGTV